MIKIVKRGVINKLTVNMLQAAYVFLSSFLAEAYRPQWPGAWDINHTQAEAVLSSASELEIYFIVCCEQLCLAFCLWLAAKHGHWLSQEQVQEADTWVVPAIKGLMVGAFAGKPILQLW